MQFCQRSTVVVVDGVNKWRHVASSSIDKQGSEGGRGRGGAAAAQYFQSRRQLSSDQMLTIRSIDSDSTRRTSQVLVGRDGRTSPGRSFVGRILFASRRHRGHEEVYTTVYGRVTAEGVSGHCNFEVGCSGLMREKLHNGVIGNGV